MAIFSSLHHVALVLAERIDMEMTGSIAQAGAPLDDTTDTTDAVRVTILWTTPQPTHRNDPWERGEDGVRTPTPLSLSVFVLVTTYGSSQGDPIAAYGNLGKILQLFHSNPVLELPLSGPDVTPVGDGELSVVLVPTAADLMEKVYSPLQIKHRPWALFEVGPVQLEHLQSTAPAEPVVHPGGVRMVGPEALARPVLRRISPSESGPGLRVRLDAEDAGSVAHVHVGSTRIPAADLLVPVPDGPVFATLPDAGPDAVAPGLHRVSMTVGALTSEPVSLRVRVPTLPAISSPATPTVPITAAFALAGQALDGASKLVLWPDRGIDDPANEVKECDLASADSSSVSVTASELLARNVRTGVLYRCAVRIGDHVFTPWALVEFAP